MQTMLIERYLIIAAVLAGSHIATGWWFYGAGRDHEIAAQSREHTVEQRATAAAASAAANAIAGIKVTNRTIQNEVQREISERVVYRDCQHSAEQLQRLNAAIAGRAQPAGSGELPAAGAAH